MKKINKNRRIYKIRTCPECGSRHFRGENLCTCCMNARAEARKKNSIKIKDPKWVRRRLERFEKHKKRIRTEMKAIKAAGLSPEDDSVYEILDAGVKLDETINFTAFERVAG